MQRYFAETKNNNILVLSKQDEHHITKVMRMKTNEKIEIVYDSTLYICSLISISPVEVEIIKQIENTQDFFNITIAQALVKEQKMDLILQKTTELGVSTIIPVKCERSVVKIEEKENKKISRWKLILKEASEQSKRVSIPNILNPVSIKELSKLDYDIKILCSVNELSINLKRVLSKVKNNDKLIIVIGPEGGFDPLEEKILIENGFISTSLGNLVLRTETASIYVLSIMNYLNLK